MDPQRVIVIGASAGGVHALMALTAGLPADIPAAVLVVLHIGAHKSLLPSLLGRACQLPVKHAESGDSIQGAHVYVAPPDHHLLVAAGRLRLTRGPKEHHARPAIDPLFRSVALAFGPRAIGVVLTGRLDDGTSGLHAIKDSGGTAVVQSPEDAIEPSMPESALQHVEVDHCVPLALMPALLSDLARAQVPAARSRDQEKNMHEHELSLRQGNALEHLQSIGRPSTFTCPDCHGDLWEILDSRPQRYRCHTGHAFTLRTLEHTVSEGTDAALQNALRAMQEKQLLLEHIAQAEGGTIGSTLPSAKKAALRLKLQVDKLQELVEDEGSRSLDQ
jgi:two-component system, chemotaxis family, protein-glutamate methylesterase/glutaminase